MGVDKAKEYAKEADLIIYVVDASRNLDENDEKIFDLIYDISNTIYNNKGTKTIMSSFFTAKGVDQILSLFQFIY